MKQTRRGFLGRVAAIAAAVAVAPAVKAEAAPVERACCNGACGGQGIGEAMPTLRFTGPADSGYFTASDGLWHRAENGVDMGAVTFEAQHDDCAAQGHGLYIAKGPYWFAHGFPPRPGEAGWHWEHFEYDPSMPLPLAEVDAWRRGLHLQSVTDLTKSMVADFEAMGII